VRKADNFTAICEPIIWKILEPWRLTILWDSTACYRDSFTLLYPVGQSPQNIQHSLAIMCKECHMKVLFSISLSSNVRTWRLWHFRHIFLSIISYYEFRIYVLEINPCYLPENPKDRVQCFQLKPR
jgi:hypothetical protein